MRRINKLRVVIISCFFITICIKGQEVVVLDDFSKLKLIPGTYYKTPDSLISKLEGVWKYQEDNLVAKIKFIPVKVEFQGFFLDQFEIEWCYSSTEDCEFKKSRLMSKNCVVDLIDGANFFKLRFADEVYNKYGEVTFTLFENGTKAIWKLKNFGLSVNGSTAQEFSVKTDMIFEKETSLD